LSSGHSLESKKCDFSVKVSYLEIYNEELNDLLGEVQTPEELAKGARRGENLKMKTSTAKAAEERSKKLMLCDSAKGVVCNNLVETICESSDEVLACVAKGAKTRKVVATLMNAESSRSHSIFTLKVRRSVAAVI
jgi:kinesin family protein 11